MYGKLNMPYVLRGFKEIPYILINKKNGTAKILNKFQFHVLSYCNGNIDLELVLWNQKEREILRQLEESGIIRLKKEPQKMNPIQEYKRVNNHYIRSIHWSVTGKCNLKCRHCYMSAPDYKYHDMNTEECMEIIEQFAQANVSTITLTGGELFTRSDIFLIIDKIYEKGMEIPQIYTNGLLVTNSILDWFIERKKKPDFVLSFDGVRCHDWMRGVAGTEQNTILAIRKIKQKGFSVLIESALCRENLRTLISTYHLLKELEIDYWKTSLVFAAGKWTEQKNVHITVPELYQHYLDIIWLYSEDQAPFTIQLDGFFACPAHNLSQYHSPYVKKRQKGWENRFSCDTCRIHPYLLSDGTLIPCATMTDSLIQAKMPNLRQEKLPEIYQQLTHPFFQAANRKIIDVVEKNKDCRICDYRFRCDGGCPAMSLLEGQGFWGHASTICTFFKGGYEKKIEETVKMAVMPAERRDKMNSLEQLKELLEKEPEAEKELKEILELPEEEAKQKLRDFAEANGIHLKEEDFIKEIKEKDLKQVTGGLELSTGLSIISLINSIFPSSTGRAVAKGTGRFRE